MDHEYIQERQVVDRYVQGRLSEAEADLFEDHYLTCDECLERLRIAEKFQRGFRQVAAEEAAGVGILAALLRSRRGLALASVFAVLLAVSALLAVRSARLGSDLEEARARLAQARVEEERSEAAARSEAESLRSRLAQEREARGRLEEEATRSLSPQGAWIVTLVPVRSGPAAGEPAQRVTLPPTTQWLVLALDLELDAASTFRAVLERQGGGAVWTGEGLRPSPRGELAIGLDSSLLAPGDYRLRVEQGPGVSVARITFRAGR